MLNNIPVSNRLYGDFLWTDYSTWVSLYDSPRTHSYLFDYTTCQEVMFKDHDMLLFSHKGVMIFPVLSCVPVLMALINPGLPLPDMLGTYSGFGSHSITDVLISEDFPDNSVLYIQGFSIRFELGQL